MPACSVIVMCEVLFLKQHILHHTYLVEVKVNPYFYLIVVVSNDVQM